MKRIILSDIQIELENIKKEREQKRFYYRHLAENEIQFNSNDFNQIHNLDKVDYAICAAAGAFGGIVDILFIGIPHPDKGGVSGGVLDGIVRAWFDKKFPKEKMEKIGRCKAAKVPYDAQDNRNLYDKPNEPVDGLSAYYHRLLSLGHDPFLGFFVGVYDIIRGTMTTISKSGDFTSQQMPMYVERMTTSILEAIKKQWLHMKSDVNTSMGLPVPLMALFNTLQFGEFGKDKQTIAEVVQGMYYQGYDFQHFCAMSIPQILVEIIVRAAWWIRTKKAIPVLTSRNRTPKLDTMLCLAHSIACGINAVKVGVTENPCAINYPEWCRFMELLVREARWQFVDKSTARLNYVTDRLIAHPRKYKDLVL